MRNNRAAANRCSSVAWPGGNPHPSASRPNLRQRLRLGLQTSNCEGLGYAQNHFCDGIAVRSRVEHRSKYRASSPQPRWASRCMVRVVHAHSGGQRSGPGIQPRASVGSLRRKCWWSDRWSYCRLETPRWQDRWPREWSMASAERQ